MASISLHESVTTSPAATAAAPRPQADRPRRGLWLGVVLAIAASAIVGSAVHDLLFHRQGAEAAPEPATPAPATGSAPAGLFGAGVTLTEGKREAAEILVGPVERVALPREVGVTGRVGPNLDRRVLIRPRVSGVIARVHVNQGEDVKAGQLLLTLDSADVGTGRLNLRTHQRELSTARTEAEWRQTVASNVAQLIAALRKTTPSKEIETAFADRPLGEDRAKLLAAYSELEIALHEEQKQTDLFRRQIIGEHPMFLAIHTREAQARFEAMLEQVKFDIGQRKRLADQRVRDAEAGVIDAAQRLRILGVREEIPAILARSPALLAQEAASEESDDVTTYQIFAPFAGRIVARLAVPSQRAEPTDALLTLVDLSKVWVSADVPESALPTLAEMAPGRAIALSATAYPGRTFEAKVISVGSEVDRTTRTVSLVAEADDPDRLLKLGMFVRVVLTAGEEPPALALPSAAVVEIEGRDVVFVPDGPGDGLAYHPRLVTAGRAADGRRIILAGLDEGDRVVTQGAFLLKSELILQNEVDEE